MSTVERVRNICMQFYAACNITLVSFFLFISLLSRRRRNPIEIRTSGWLSGAPRHDEEIHQRNNDDVDQRIAQHLNETLPFLLILDAQRLEFLKRREMKKR